MTTTQNLAAKTNTLNLNTAIDCLLHIEANTKTADTRMVASQIIDSIEANHPAISEWIDTYFENDGPTNTYVALIQQAREELGI